MMAIFAFWSLSHSASTYAEICFRFVWKHDMPFWWVCRTMPRLLIFRRIVFAVWRGTSNSGARADTGSGVWISIKSNNVFCSVFDRPSVSRFSLIILNSWSITCNYKTEKCFVASFRHCFRCYFLIIRRRSWNKRSTSRNTAAVSSWYKPKHLRSNILQLFITNRSKAKNTLHLMCL